MVLKSLQGSGEPSSIGGSMGAWCWAIVEPLVGRSCLRGCTSGEKEEAQHIASWVFCNIIGDPNYLIGDLPDLE